MGERLWLGPPTGTGLALSDPPGHEELLLVAGAPGWPRCVPVEQVAAGGRQVTLVVGSRTFTCPTRSPSTSSSAPTG